MERKVRDAFRSRIKLDKCNFTEFNTGLRLKWQQYKAMLLKRFLNARREKRLVLTQLILPLLMVCLALLLIKTLQEPMQNEPPRILNLSNLSIKGAPNTGFYADFRPGIKNELFDVSCVHDLFKAGLR